MIGYLGIPGALQALPYRGGLSTATARPVQVDTTLGGRRYALLGHRSRREWSVSFDLIGSVDTHGLLAATRATRSLIWLPADATAGNLLSPQAAAWEPAPSPGTDAGLAALPDGTVARSVAASGTIRIGDAHGAAEWVPVRPGEPVSVGSWGLGGWRALGFWRDATGANLGSWNTPISTHAGWAWREGTLTPPAGAAYIELHLRDGAAFARPTVSWGTKAIDRPGRGCPKAIVHGLSEGLTLIALDDAYGPISVTITELG